jgi:TetR/AcrR family transcriptional regulator, transcriptional repressor for nem operon
MVAKKIGPLKIARKSRQFLLNKQMETFRRNYVIDTSIHNGINYCMARPLEFDRDAALEQAGLAFRAKSYASTSTDDLIRAMGIGRQSLYNAFGDKWQLYLTALTDYLRRSTSAHVQRLHAGPSALQGIREMLEGLAVEDDALRAMGCMGVGAVCEFGAEESQVAELRSKSSNYLRSKLVKSVREGQASGEIDQALNPEEAASYLLMCMTGIQLAARGGAKTKELSRLARFAADRMKAH